MSNLKTENCIICGSKATNWHGHVIAKQKMALGNFVDKKIIAGFCNEHSRVDNSDENGCYGDYNSELMGECTPLFIKGE